MRHNIAGRLFGRTANQRKALLRGLATAVIENERIETTVAKAKETRRIVEKLVTLGKRGDLNSKRIAMSKVPNRRIIQKLFDEIAPRFADRNGGYMRVVHTRQRVNDRAEMAVLEFVDYEDRRDKSEAGATKETAKTGKAADAKKEAAPKKAADAEAGAEPKKAPAKKKAAPKKAAAAEAGAEPKKAPAKKKAAPKKAADAEAGAEPKKAPAKKKAAPKKKTPATEE